MGKIKLEKPAVPRLPFICDSVNLLCHSHTSTHTERHTHKHTCLFLYYFMLFESVLNEECTSFPVVFSDIQHYITYYPQWSCSKHGQKHTRTATLGAPMNSCPIPLTQKNQIGHYCLFKTRRGEKEHREIQ